MILIKKYKSNIILKDKETSLLLTPLSVKECVSGPASSTFEVSSFPAYLGGCCSPSDPSVNKIVLFGEIRETGFKGSMKKKCFFTLVLICLTAC